ncbi:uncharacterized protein TNCV_3111441 [Trichonephila clavipes]|nr:uncharacterized protein TNCV_3111441 [Trichonephila clavipes]
MESRFNLSSDDNRVRVWKPRGERLNPTFVLQRHTTPSAGVMIWVLLPTIHVVSDADCCAVGPGLNPVEDMDVCKCIVPSRHGGTLNSRRATTPFVRSMEGKEMWEAPEHPQDVFLQKLG